MKKKYALQALAALAAVWGLVWAVGAAADASVPTPAKLLDFLAADPLQYQLRGSVIGHVARDYSRLTLGQKRELRATGTASWDGFVGRLTPEEKNQFVELLLPAGFHEMLDAFSKMPDEDRQKTLDRARNELMSRLPDESLRQQFDGIDAALLNVAVKAGLGNVFDHLPPDTKLQLLPFIEQLQQNLRKLHGDQ